MKARVLQPKNSARQARPHAQSGVTLRGGSQVFIAGVLMILFGAAGMYLYSVNRNAVQGYHLRSLEKQIATLSERNAELQITEADMRSFYRINAVKDDLQMEKAESIKYLEPPKDTVALR